MFNSWGQANRPRLEAFKVVGRSRLRHLCVRPLISSYRFLTQDNQSKIQTQISALLSRNETCPETCLKLVLFPLAMHWFAGIYFWWGEFSNLPLDFVFVCFVLQRGLHLRPCLCGAVFAPLLPSDGPPGALLLRWALRETFRLTGGPKKPLLTVAKRPAFEPLLLLW